jgi:hypothetical protein
VVASDFPSDAGLIAETLRRQGYEPVLFAEIPALLTYPFGEPRSWRGMEVAARQ